MPADPDPVDAALEGDPICQADGAIKRGRFDHLLAPFLYTLSTMHCMMVSLAYGGEGLGTMWGKEKALELLAEAGFTDTEVHQLPHDLMNYYYVSTRKES